MRLLLSRLASVGWAPICVGALMSGCSTAPKPAKLSQAPSAEQRAELAQAVTKLTGSRDWTYNVDKLFTDGSLTARPMGGMMNDRAMGTPMTFSLMRAGANCLLTAGDQQVELSTVTCEAL